MALSEQDKQRIREEEAYRQQVREDLRRQGPNARLKAIVFWIVLVLTAILLFAVVRRGHV
jgi:hypothetical protein